MSDPDNPPVRCTCCGWTGEEDDLLVPRMPFGFIVLCPKCGCETIEWPT